MAVRWSGPNFILFVLVADGLHPSCETQHCARTPHPPTHSTTTPTPIAPPCDVCGSVHSEHLLGTTVALFSVGRLVFSAASGWMTQWMHPLSVIQVSLVVNAVGALLYMLALEWGLWALILGRMCLGFGSGVLAVSRTVVGHGTTPAQRTRYIAVVDACRFVGFSVTCALGWALNGKKGGLCTRGACFACRHARMCLWGGCTHVCVVRGMCRHTVSAGVSTSVGSIVLDRDTSPGLLLFAVNAAALAYGHIRVRPLIGTGRLLGGACACCCCCCFSRRGPIGVLAHPRAHAHAFVSTGSGEVHALCRVWVVNTAALPCPALPCLALPRNHAAVCRGARPAPVVAIHFPIVFVLQTTRRWSPPPALRRRPRGGHPCAVRCSWAWRCWWW